MSFISISNKKLAIFLLGIRTISIKKLNGLRIKNNFFV
jgi:hypothetical protein